MHRISYFCCYLLFFSETTFLAQTSTHIKSPWSGRNPFQSTYDLFEAAWLSFGNFNSAHSFNFVVRSDILEDGFKICKKIEQKFHLYGRSSRRRNTKNMKRITPVKCELGGQRKLLRKFTSRHKYENVKGETY
jgi:hypothetical protein